MWALPGELAGPVVLYATPLVLAATGELVVQRSGVVNIGIEGMMLAGALGAWVASAHYGPVAGVAGGIAAGLALGVAFALVTLVFAADQIVAGTGINLLALGATGMVHKALAAAADEGRVQRAGVHVLPWFVLILCAGVWALLARTRPGLELSALGESPEAAETAGVPVRRRRLYAVLFGAACAGLAGAYLSTMRTASFTENMTAGDGFLALGIVIFGRWSVSGVVAAAVFFGVIRAAADRLALWPRFADPAGNGLLKALPYVLSLLALAGLAGRSRSPAALGRPYVRQ